MVKYRILAAPWHSRAVSEGHILPAGRGHIPALNCLQCAESGQLWCWGGDVQASRSQKGKFGFICLFLQIVLHISRDFTLGKLTESHHPPTVFFWKGLDFSAFILLQISDCSSELITASRGRDHRRSLRALQTAALTAPLPWTNGLAVPLSRSSSALNDCASYQKPASVKPTRLGQQLPRLFGALRLSVLFFFSLSYFQA